MVTDITVFPDDGPAQDMREGPDARAVADPRAPLDQRLLVNKNRFVHISDALLIRFIVPGVFRQVIRRYS